MNKKIKTIISNKKGAMLVLALVSTTVFLSFITGLATLNLYRQKLYRQQAAKQEALHVAEAGINYYVWLLAHNNDDYYDGTGSDPGPAGEPYGPYEHVYTAPSSGLAGTYSLEITPPTTGSTIIGIKSTGWLNDYPNIKRSVEVRYGIPSLAQYSLLVNTNIWLGPSESTNGPFHSNGGIRMDGPNDSLVTSARDTYICTSSHGCTVSNCSAPCSWNSGACNCPGVWGAGPNSDLWNSPVPSVDFNAITADISQMRTDAQADGIYFDSSGGGNDGYHVVFLADGTFDVYIINDLGASFQQLNDAWTGWVGRRENISTETFDSNNAIPANGIIFFEDDVWVEGIVNGRATLVAAKLPDNPAQRKSIYIPDNITYLARDGSNALGLIAQRNIQVLRLAPSDLTIDGVLLAQNGHVFRNYYRFAADRIVDNRVEMYGGIISYMERNFTWVDGGGNTLDGYNTTVSIYDPQVTFSPPPSFPTTGEYAFISWEEE